MRRSWLSPVAARLGLLVFAFFWVPAVLGTAVFAVANRDVPAGLAVFYSVIAILVGMVAPGILVWMLLRGTGRRRTLVAREQERELLDLLYHKDMVTAVSAAMDTSLTVSEAESALEEMVRGGHVAEVMTTDAIYYRLHDGLKAPRGPATRPAESLSEREVEVLALIDAGKSNKEIARDLVISLGTVKSHANSIFRKLDAKSRTEAVANARSMGLLPDRPQPDL